MKKQKRFLKEQEAAERLRQVDLGELEYRLRDMARGAMAEADIDEEDMDLCAAMGLEAWAQWIGAVKASFRESGINGAPAGSIAWEFWNLHHFGSFEGAAEFLHGMGARP